MIFLLKFQLTLLLLISVCAEAAPNRLDIIFLSAEGFGRMEQKKGILFYPHLFAQSSYSGGADCLPMGDGCFHPQLGYIEDFKKKAKLVQPKPIEMKTFNSTDINLVECQKGNYFDIFCGKESGVVSKTEIELWIDTSSSMRKMDYVAKGGAYCQRRSFAQEIKKTCGEKASYYVFNTAIKQVGDFSSFCINYGMNDTKRMMDWIKRSKVKHLIMLTDIDEHNIEFREFLDSLSAKIYGVGTTVVTSKQIPALVPKIINNCK